MKRITGNLRHCSFLNSSLRKVLAFKLKVLSNPWEKGNPYYSSFLTMILCLGISTIVNLHILAASDRSDMSMPILQEGVIKVNNALSSPGSEGTGLISGTVEFRIVKSKGVTNVELHYPKDLGEGRRIAKLAYKVGEEQIYSISQLWNGKRWHAGTGSKTSLPGKFSADSVMFMIYLGFLHKDVALTNRFRLFHDSRIESGSPYYCVMRLINKKGDLPLEAEAEEIRDRYQGTDKRIFKVAFYEVEELVEEGKHWFPSRSRLTCKVVSPQIDGPKVYLDGEVHLKTHLADISQMQANTSEAGIYELMVTNFSTSGTIKGEYPLKLNKTIKYQFSDGRFNAELDQKRSVYYNTNKWLTKNQVKDLDSFEAVQIYSQQKEGWSEYSPLALIGCISFAFLIAFLAVKRRVK